MEISYAWSDEQVRIVQRSMEWQAMEEQTMEKSR